MYNTFMRISMSTSLLVFQKLTGLSETSYQLAVRCRSDLLNWSQTS